MLHKQVVACFALLLSALPCGATSCLFSSARADPSRLFLSEAAPEASGRAHLLRRFHDHGDLSPDQPGDQSINQDHWILILILLHQRGFAPTRHRAAGVSCPLAGGGWRGTSALPAAAKPARHAQPATLLPARMLPSDFDQHNVLYRS